MFQQSDEDEKNKICPNAPARTPKEPREVHFMPLQPPGAFILNKLNQIQSEVAAERQRQLQAELDKIKSTLRDTSPWDGI